MLRAPRKNLPAANAPKRWSQTLFFRDARPASSHQPREWLHRSRPPAPSAFATGGLRERATRNAGRGAAPPDSEIRQTASSANLAKERSAHARAGGGPLSRACSSGNGNVRGGLVRAPPDKCQPGRAERPLVHDKGITRPFRCAVRTAPGKLSAIDLSCGFFGEAVEAMAERCLCRAFPACE